MYVRLCVKIQPPNLPLNYLIIRNSYTKARQARGRGTGNWKRGCLDIYCICRLLNVRSQIT